MNNSFESIKNYLLEQGYELEKDTFTKIQCRKQLVVVNGQQHQLVQEFKLQFVYLGDGYVEDADGTQKETCGMSFKINGLIMAEVWAHDVKDFIHLLRV